MYIYIYIERERERERDSLLARGGASSETIICSATYAGCTEVYPYIALLRQKSAGHSVPWIYINK